MMDSYFAKQPILDVKGETYGYSILYRASNSSQAQNGSGKNKSTAALVNNIFFSGLDNGMSKDTKLFFKFNESLLTEKTALLFPKEQIIIELCANEIVSDDALDCCYELHEKGYFIVLCDFLFEKDKSELLDYAQMVKIDMRKDRAETEKLAALCRRYNKRILADKVETAAVAEYAKRLGCSLIQGYFFAQPLIAADNSYNPMVVTFSRLMECLWEVPVDIDALVKIVSADPFMTAKLLRLVNSVRSDMSQHISSIKQAIVMLGINKLKDWIYLVGLQTLSRERPDETIKVALFRAIFGKEIASQTSNDPILKEEMYLIGLMSIVVDHNDTQTMKTLMFSDNISGGLSGAPGIHSDTYRFVEDYEQGNWENVDAYVKAYKLKETSAAKIYIDSMNKVDDMFEQLKG